MTDSFFKISSQLVFGLKKFENNYSGQESWEGEVFSSTGGRGGGSLGVTAEPALDISR